MSDLYLASIDVTKIDKSKLVEFTRKDGTKGVSLNVAIWIDPNPDADWKACSVQQSTKKDDPKIYLGNGKKWQSKPHDSTPEHDANEKEVSEPDWLKTDENGEADDLPF